MFNGLVSAHEIVILICWFVLTNKLWFLVGSYIFHNYNIVSETGQFLIIHLPTPLPQSPPFSASRVSPPTTTPTPSTALFPHQHSYWRLFLKLHKLSE